MDYSIFFLKFFGYFFFLVSAALLMSKEGKVALLEMAAQPSFILSSGFMVLIVGLPVIILHNVWIFNVLGLVTLLGWLSVLKGVIRLAKPNYVARLQQKFTTTTTSLLVFDMLLGLGLMYAGYFPYWC